MCKNYLRMDLLSNISEKWPVVQFLAAFLGCLNTMSSGMHFGWTSPSLPKLQSNNSSVPITNEEGSTVASILVIGVVSGCILVGLINNKIGRKPLIIITSIPAIISWILIAFANNVGLLMAGRYLGGICDGMIFCVLTVYVSEISQPKYRGLLGSSLGFTYAFGHLLINVIGSYCSIPDTALISATAPVILVIAFYWMPESPYYLLMQNNVEEAKRSLRILNGPDNYEEDANRIMKGINKLNFDDGNYLDLIKVPYNRRILLHMVILGAIQQASGETAILFYTQSIFFNVQTISAENCATIYLAMELVALAIPLIFIDRFGRKPLLIISLCGCAVALLVVAAYFYIQNRTNIDLTYFNLVPIISLTVYVFMFGIGLQTIPSSIAGELFISNVRGYGTAITEISIALFAGVAAKYFQITKDTLGLEVPFITFSVCCILGAIFVSIFLLETKNKTLEQIQTELIV